MTAFVLLAVDPQGPNASKVSPGLLGFITVFLLALAVVVLVRSMTKHLRKVRYSPGPDGRMWTPPGTVVAGAIPAAEPGDPSGGGAPRAPAGDSADGAEQPPR